METDKLTTERGKNYGHPLDHFKTTQCMYAHWDERRRGAPEAVPYPLEQPLRHIVYMICDKLARAANNPMHLDNFDDIQGYASLWRKCVDEVKERG